MHASQRWSSQQQQAQYLNHPTHPGTFPGNPPSYTPLQHDSPVRASQQQQTSRQRLASQHRPSLGQAQPTYAQKLEFSQQLQQTSHTSRPKTPPSEETLKLQDDITKLEKWWNKPDVNDFSTYVTET